MCEASAWQRCPKRLEIAPQEHASQFRGPKADHDQMWQDRPTRSNQVRREVHGAKQEAARDVEINSDRFCVS